MDVVVIIDTKNQELAVFNCSFDEGKNMTIMGGIVNILTVLG